jgi:hypothetical protein
MLPTPAKTPQKPPTEENKADIKGIARNLFHGDAEVLPSPKKTRANKYTLDSFSADDGGEDPIQIYTDSHERIPEVDASSDNPFYGHQPASRETAKRRSARQRVAIPGEGSVSVEDAIRREDGMLIVL